MKTYSISIKSIDGRFYEQVKAPMTAAQALELQNKFRARGQIVRTI